MTKRKLTTDNIHAVLTGDLIGSTHAGSAAIENAMTTLAIAAERVIIWDGVGDSRFTRFRGDGWQIVVSYPGLALRSALYIVAALRASLAKADTRISIGIGKVTSLGTADLSDASGEAFAIAGRGLDNMRGPRRLSVEGEGVSEPLKAIASLLEDRALRWSPEQAEAMLHYLQPDNPTLKEVASRIGISPQAVGYRLSGAGGVRIRQALNVWEDTLDNKIIQGMPS
jgi:hypothetical protein